MVSDQLGRHSYKLDTEWVTERWRNNTRVNLDMKAPKIRKNAEGGKTTHSNPIQMSTVSGLFKIFSASQA